MWFSGKKKKSQDAEDSSVEKVEAKPTKAGSGKADSKKAKDSLSHVIDETEPGAVLELIKDNTKWLLPDGRGVVLTLFVDRPIDDGGIGGLGRVSAKGNEAKGSLLERIKADAVQVVETEDMLEFNALGLIPTDQTLGPDGVGEYTMFDRAIFVLSVAYRDGDGLLQVEPIATAYDPLPSGDKDAIQLKDAQKIRSGGQKLSDLIPGLWAQLGGSEEPEEEEEEEVLLTPQFETVGSSDDDEVSEDISWDPDDVPDEAEEGASVTDEGMGSEENIDDVFAESEEEPDADWVQTDVAEPESEPVSEPEPVVEEVVPETVGDDRVFDAQSVQNTLARRFLDEDLNLEIDMTPFETIFGRYEREPLSFGTEHLTDSWMDNHIRLMIQQANGELAQARSAHINELRQNFISILSSTGDEISSKMSVNKESKTVWGKSIAEIEAKADMLRENKADSVEAKRKELLEEYEAKRTTAANAERELAMARYDDRHRPALERKLADIEPEFEAKVVADYERERRSVLDARRRAAIASFDTSITYTINHLIEENQDRFNKESELVEHHRELMREFIDANRKDDIARANALAEELSRSNVVEEERQLYAQREKELREEIEQIQRKAREDIARAEDEALSKAEQARLEYEQHINDARAQTEAAEERARGMLTQIDFVRETTSKQFESHIEALESDKRALVSLIERDDTLSKRANTLYVALAVLVALAFLAVGVITGMVISNNSGGSSQAGVMMEQTTAVWGGSVYDDVV